MENPAYNKDSLRSRVDTFILEALSKEDKYGYEILKEIDEKCKGAFVLKQPTMYSCLKRLESKDFIKSYLGDESNGGQRRYYGLTDKGREYLVQDVKEWEFSRTIINKLLSEREFDFDNESSPFSVNEMKPLTKRDRVKTLNIKDEDFNTSLNDEEDDEKSEEIKINDFNDNKLKENDVKNNNDIAKDLNNQKNDYLINESDTDNSYIINEVNDDKINNKEKINSSKITVEQIDNQANLNNKVYTGRYKTIDEVFNKEKEQYNLKKEEISKNQDNSSAPITTEVYNNQNNQQFEEKIPYLSHNSSNKIDEYYEKNDIKYRPALDEIFAKKDVKSQNIERKINNYIQDNNDNINNNYNDWNRTDYSLSVRNNMDIENNLKELKGKLYNEGYNLRPYSNSVSSKTYYSNSYIYSNRIRLETSVLLYLVMVIETFITYFAIKSKFSYEIGDFITAALILAAYPFFNLIAYLVNPMLKKNAHNFIFKNSLLNSIMFYLILLVIVILCGFIIVGADIYDSKSIFLPIIVPSVLFLNIPIYICLYGLLFKTNKYHVK